MGLTTLEVEIADPSRRSRAERLTLLVDSGAVYSVVPSTVLRRLGIRPIRREKFSLADGTVIVRGKGAAFFKYGDRIGVSDVVFGVRGDSVLLGALTLESLGLILDPLRRQLRPLPMILAVAGAATP